ncbi:MAG TPA: diacylglycerol kinase family lipid kinase [Bacteroidetes bacterium]|nr:diacylglycerol kinase family lipid kinase [Bacteroidota bacterium]
MEKYLYKDLWFCIFNPIAGRADHDSIRQEIEANFDKHNMEYALYATACKGDATKIVEEKILEGYTNFVAAGGDGTVHEVVNGIMKQDFVNTEEITLAVIPIGTGNDWAKHHNIPLSINESVAFILKGNTSKQDIGKVDFIDLEDNPKTEYFNNVAGMAYDAFVVKKLEERKSKPNKFVYIFSVLFYLFQFRKQLTKVELNDLTLKDKYYTINAGICKYSGGGMSLVPHAKHDDGLFAITLAGNISKLDVVLNTWRFYNDSITMHPKIDAYFSKSMKVDSETEYPVLLELDGELVGKTPADFNIMPSALKFISAT